MKCECGWEWTPRKANPVKCPRCWKPLHVDFGLSGLVNEVPGLKSEPVNKEPFRPSSSVVRHNPEDFGYAGTFQEEPPKVPEEAFAYLEEIRQSQNALSGANPRLVPKRDPDEHAAHIKAHLATPGFKKQPVMPNFKKTVAGFDSASFSDGATVEQHGGKVPLVAFKKVIADPTAVEELVEAARAKREVPNAEAETGGSKTIQKAQYTNSDREKVDDTLDEGVKTIKEAVRNFPTPRCPKCRNEMTDTGDFFECGKGVCRQKPISVDEMKERYERERGE